ncbi:related to arginase/agmatinase/formimionoglutamate hydrolase, arginase family [Ramularia collo-cygni]|uniref:Related to arginase/agmatinase/formimionoglutamate hydrolase, arginase family n=1 Tax=Ramularia collo-cygni TaxID=112498 RepID=A0A2D3V300_9PEZI|nr:related to arginase/agmatinase/formimionoglutamate hydrolase, arginase family [Ramularia collo-cygni]CZT16864.1 related to arginase/agmatinase/formimionoglutamate hydrolase, arginase family [Ramularia collo-cygni]
MSSPHAAQQAKSITLIISPFHVGIANHRVGNGPNRILQRAIVSELEKLNVAVTVKKLEPVDSFEGEIGRSFALLAQTSKAVTDAVNAGSFPLILSGNCHATIAAASGLNLTHIGESSELGFVYFDAHDDLESPSTNTNGYFDAMGMNILKGESWHALSETIPGFKPYDLKKLVYCGLRDIQDCQRQMVKDMGLDVVWGSTEKHVEYEADLSAILERRRLGSVCVHLDLDVLDDTLGPVNEYPSPGGMLESDVLSCLKMVPNKCSPASLTVCSFNPDAGDGDKIADIAVKAVVGFVGSLVETGALSRKL